jgi:hypothetical protein
MVLIFFCNWIKKIRRNTPRYANLNRIDQALQPVMSNLFPFFGQRVSGTAGRRLDTPSPLLRTESLPVVIHSQTAFRVS